VLIDTRNPGKGQLDFAGVFILKFQFRGDGCTQFYNLEVYLYGNP
jgi:hypothetical protein